MSSTCNKCLSSIVVVCLGVVALVGVLHYLDAPRTIYWRHRLGLESSSTARRRMADYPYRDLEVSFMVANQYGLNANYLIQQNNGLYGMEPAFASLAQMAANTRYDTSLYRHDPMALEDIECPPCVDILYRQPGTAGCMKATGKFRISVHPGTMNPGRIPGEMTSHVQTNIRMGNLCHDNNQFCTYDGFFSILDESSLCRSGVGRRGITRPAGVPVGYEDIAGDMSYRFSKNPKLNPPYWELGTDPEYYELDEDFYPLNPIMLQELQTKTAAISVYAPYTTPACQLLSPYEMLQASKVMLTHPNNDPDSQYWDELWEVILVQIMRQNNLQIERIMPMPAQWAGLSMTDVANAVHDEYPGLHHMELLKTLFGGALDIPRIPNCPGCASVDRSIIPSTSSAEFVQGIVMLADLLNWAIATVGPINFCTKWQYGRSRPEEIVWKIYNGDLGYADGVPMDLINTVQEEFDLTRMQDFTAYPEGSPDHPSFPAMHSAGSAASLWMAVVLNLTEEQWCEVKKIDYAVSYARTVAGVHYYTDNIGGLNIGQEIIARTLADHLVEQYGSDRATVQSKIDMYRFDWNEFQSSDCYLGN